MLTPQNLQLLKTTEGSLTLSWDEVIDVDYYLISYYPMGYQTSVKQVRVPKGQLSYEIVGLHPSTTYNITLRHVKKGISSDPENLQASTGETTSKLQAKDLLLCKVGFKLYQWSKPLGFRGVCALYQSLFEYWKNLFHFLSKFRVFAFLLPFKDFIFQIDFWGGGGRRGVRGEGQISFSPKVPAIGLWF